MDQRLMDRRKDRWMDRQMKGRNDGQMNGGLMMDKGIEVNRSKIDLLVNGCIVIMMNRKKEGGTGELAQQ